MNLTIFRRSLRLQRRALVGWTIAFVLLTIVTLVSWPSIREGAEEFQKAIDTLPASMKAFVGDLSDATTGPGFIRGRLFALMLPLLFLVHVVGRASDTIAGEEERGALDLLLAQTNPRAQLLWQKSAAIALGVLLLELPLVVLLILGDLVFTLDLHWGRLVVTFVMLLLHTYGVGGIALAVGASTGRKAYAIAAGAGVGAAGFIFEGLANLAKEMEFLRYASTFYYYGGGKTLTTIDPWIGLIALTLLTAATIIVSLILFERRDIAVA